MIKKKGLVRIWHQFQTVASSIGEISPSRSHPFIEKKKKKTITEYCKICTVLVMSHWITNCIGNFHIVVIRFSNICSQI